MIPGADECAVGRRDADVVDDGGPGALTVLRAEGLRVRLDERGTVVEVAAPGGPAWLVEAGVVEVSTSAGPLDLGAPRVAVDVDEVETERSAGALRAVVRHGTDPAWTVRVVLVNDSDAPLELTRVALRWRAAAGTVVTALAAGARASHAVQAAAGDGPVLVGRLRSGAQPGVDEAGLLLGPLTLGPHQRWAASWRWEVVADPRRAGAADLPRTTWLDLAQTAVLPGDPDVAVVAPGLAVEVGEDVVEVAAAEPGAYGVELRGARGTASYALTWAPDLDDLVDAEVAAVLAGRRTPAGTVRLAGAATGIVVQDALARRSAGPPEELADALELAAGLVAEQLDEAGGADGLEPDPVGVAFLAREADRTGSATLLGTATRALLRATVPAPGLGLAGFALVLAQVRGGGSGREVVEHLAALRPASDAGADPDRDGGLEVALLLRPRDARPDERVLAGLRRLGESLGAGLPGRVVPAPELVRVAYASTVLALVDEPTGQRLRGRWGCSVPELARRAAAQARARVAEDEGPRGRDALAWLVLGRPPG